MDSIYSAANSASRAVFGDTSTDRTDERVPRTTETNPYRGGTTSDGNPLRHATDNAPHSSGTAFGGSGTQHTAGSGGPAADHRIDLNKPIANIYESHAGKPSGTYDPTYDTRHEHADDRPITTTSMLEKPSIGDLNKDGARHEVSDVEHHHDTGVHWKEEERPTISDIGGGSGGTALPGTYPSTEAERSLRSNLPKGGDTYPTHDQPGGTVSHERTTHPAMDAGLGALNLPLSTHHKIREHHQTGSGVQPHTASTGVSSTLPSTTGEQRTSDLLPGTHDRTREHHQMGSGVQPHTASTGVSSTLPSTTGEHRTSDLLPGTHDRTREHHQTGFGVQPHTASTGVSSTLPSTTGEHRTSDLLPGTHDRTREHHQTGFGVQPHTASTGVSSTLPSEQRAPDLLPGTHDKTHEPHTASTSAHHVSGLQASADKTHQPSTDLGGSHDRHDDHHDHHPSSTHPIGQSEPNKHHTPSSSDPTHIPSTDPQPASTKPAGTILPTQKKSTEAGTGEKYEKSTGVAAEGGDFDASRPGAGREADRLLDEHGIHHGAEKKKGVDEDKDAGLHSKVERGHGEHGKTAEHAPVAGTEHKGLGEKIKEKLHLGHH